MEITSRMRGTIGWALTSALPCWVSMSYLTLRCSIEQLYILPVFLTTLFFNVDAALDRDAEGDLLLGDMGQGIPFKPGSFDGCIR